VCVCVVFQHERNEGGIPNIKARTLAAISNFFAT
jgi:hypothetical protein